MLLHNGAFENKVRYEQSLVLRSGLNAASTDLSYTVICVIVDFVASTEKISTKSHDDALAVPGPGRLSGGCEDDSDRPLNEPMG